MKRPKLVINIAILLVLSACGNSGAQAREYDAQYSQVSEIEQQSDVSKDTEIVIHEETDSYADNDMEEIGEENDQAEEAFTDEMFDLSALTPMEAFWKVLLSEAPFSCRFISSVYHGYLEDMPYYSKELVIDRFTVMDMDGDEMPEILLEVDDYMGYILLRYHEGSVDGYEIGYRAMYDIKTDGSFTQSNGAGDWRISRLFWVEDIIYYDEILNVQEGETYENYYIHDLPVDKWSMESFMELHNEKEQPEWYNFNDEMILEIVNDTEYSMEAKQFLNERQQYLDSFYYLIEPLYKNETQNEDSETKKEAGKKFYYNCIAEMNYIYDLYKETLLDAELIELENEQHRWQEEINQRLAEDLYLQKTAYSIEELENAELFYRAYGEMYIRRAFHLVNRYYEYDFYG